MEKKENTVFYKVLIIILLVALCVSVYFGFIKKDNISNNNQNESNSNSNLTTQDNKLEVEEITGFKVKELTVSINGKNSKFTISYNKTKKVDSEGNNNDAMEYQMYLNNVKVNGATGFYAVDVENGMGDYVEDVDSSILNVVKGSDGKDYLVVVFHNPNVYAGDGSKELYVIDDNSKLLAHIGEDDSTQIGNLTGTGSEKYKDSSNNYYKYNVASDRVYYLVAEESESERSECDFTEYYLTINNGKAVNNKSVVLHGSEFSGAAGTFETKIEIN